MMPPLPITPALHPSQALTSNTSLPFQGLPKEQAPSTQEWGSAEWVGVIPGPVGHEEPLPRQGAQSPLPSGWQRADAALLSTRLVCQPPGVNCCA